MLTIRISCGENSLLRNSSRLTFWSVSWDISKHYSDSDISASASFLVLFEFFFPGLFASLLKTVAGSDLNSMEIPALPVLNLSRFSEGFGEDFKC